MELIISWSAGNEDPNPDGRWRVGRLWYDVSEIIQILIVVNQEQMLVEGNTLEDSIVRYFKGLGEVVIIKPVKLVILECHGGIAER